MEENLVPLSGSATVSMLINGQLLEVVVDGNSAPISAGNFVDLVERNFYDGISFHRVETNPSFSLAQAGDPNSRDPNFPVEQLGTSGFVDPATGQERTIPLEILPVLGRSRLSIKLLRNWVWPVRRCCRILGDQSAGPVPCRRMIRHRLSFISIRPTTRASMAASLCSVR